MTTALTAKPLKITISTMRFFFGAGMADPFGFRGDIAGSDYRILPAASIPSHRFSRIIWGQKHDR